MTNYFIVNETDVCYFEFHCFGYPRPQDKRAGNSKTILLYSLQYSYIHINHQCDDYYFYLILVCRIYLSIWKVKKR